MKCYLSALSCYLRLPQPQRRLRKSLAARTQFLSGRRFVPELKPLETRNLLSGGLISQVNTIIDTSHCVFAGNNWMAMT